MGIKLSVVIPTYNRAKQLMLTMASFEKQTIPKDEFEVIVVDDKSTDETEALLSHYKAPFNFAYLQSDTRSGPAAARNRGIDAAQGKIIIFCDPDFIVLPDFIEVHNDYHKANKHSVVSGTPFSFIPIYTVYYPDFANHEKQMMRSVLKKSGLWKDEYFDSLNNVEIITAENIRKNSRKLKLAVGPFTEPKDVRHEYMKTDVAPWVLFVTRCVSVKKKYLIEAGGFDEKLPRGEDWELGYRLHKLGLKFTAINRITGYHQEHPASYRLPENRTHWYEKHGTDDPELLLLAIWLNMRVYKNTLRMLRKLSLKSVDQQHMAVTLLRALQQLAN